MVTGTVRARPDRAASTPVGQGSWPARTDTHNLRSAGRPHVVAHRGNSSVAPENTLAAFESALRAGADWLEVDVHLTRDGRVVVLHDETLDATTDGSGWLRELESSCLTDLDAGGWFAAAYAGQRVPMLADVLALLARFPGRGALVEFKSVWSVSQLAPVVAAVRASGVADRVVVQSFSITTVEGLQQLAPDLPRALLTLLPGPNAGPLCERLGLAAYNPYIAGLLRSPEVVAQVHDAGAALWAWTVDEPALWSWLLGAGVDGAITNRPDRLNGWLAAVLPQPPPPREELERMAIRQGHRTAAPESATPAALPRWAQATAAPDSVEWERLASELAR